MKDLHGIIFAYSSSVRLKELTENRTASSLPFGGRYRVIDFMLSNIVNAGISDVGIIMRENYQSLLDHLGSGKAWDLSRKHGGLRLLPPFGYADSRRDTSVYRGKLEALYGVNNYISHIRQEYILLADGDVIVNLPMEEIFRKHVDSGADITCVCAPCHMGSGEDAYFRLGKKGTVTEVLIGRPEPDTYADMGVYIISKALLENTLGYCAAHNEYDFARDVLQNMRSKLNIYAYLHTGFSARILTISDYFQQSMQLLRPEIRADLFSRTRPVKTKVRDEASAYYGPRSSVRNCVVADGSFLEGDIENSIIFRGVRVEPGAVIRNSILMQDTQVQQNANISYAITDKEVIINPGRKLMGHESYPIAISKGSVV